MIAVTSSIIGTDPLENLKRFKGELLVPFILFLIVATEFKTLDKIKKLFLAPVIAFFIYTIIVIIESFKWGLSYYWDEILRNQVRWLSGYGEMSNTLLPLTFGTFLLLKEKWRYYLIPVMLIEFLIAAAYRNISSFGGIVLVILLGAFFVQQRNYRIWMKSFIVIILLVSTVGMYTHRDHPLVIEYKTKFYEVTHPHEELKKADGFKNRMPMWEAALDVIRDRPFLGYGWGMTKYTRIVNQEKYLMKWKTSKPEAYNLYYVSHKDKFVPPHNLFLEIIVQTGIIGLLSFIVFILISLIYMIKTSIQYTSQEKSNFLIILGVGIILSFMTAGLMGNELGKLGGKVLFIVLGAGAAQIEAVRLKNPPHSSIV
jgi:O-antigen ligase